jgi:putative membrane protein
MMMNGFGMGFSWIFGLILIAVIVWAVFRLAGSGQSRDRKDPIQILKERYARGEIEKDEFERMKRELA